ncbi:hypothetical protein PVAND_012481 [Polypedilum vanderplanki]|uniref:Protein quiver n=1 Tax=Polypedilum vanderplanki TaxID=319348 RepID=A0A9J6CLS0_POLVA|nr:hypothetical protein PVAND_012481 [Polypedilum vanderplanki]
MKYFVLIFTVLFCMTIIPNNVNAIQCYDCDDLTGGNCKNVNDNMKKDCSAISTTCIKTIARGPEIDYIHRGCGPIKSVLDNDYREQKVGNYEGRYCECSKDLCNGSNNIYTKSALAISLLLAIIGMFVF